MLIPPDMKLYYIMKKNEIMIFLINYIILMIIFKVILKIYVTEP